MSKLLVNENQLKEWITTAEKIKDSFGIKKALGYLIGEKFYYIISMRYSSQKSIRSFAEERGKSDYNPTRETIYKDLKIVTNLDDVCRQDVAIIVEVEDLLTEFATLIKGAFEQYELCDYFESNPRLGAMAQIASDEEYEFLISRGFVEHSLDAEIEDALIFGDMWKYFGFS